MLAGDVRRQAIGRHLLPAKPAEGLAGRDVDALHQQQHTNSPGFYGGNVTGWSGRVYSQAPSIARTRATRNSWNSPPVAPPPPRWRETDSCAGSRATPRAPPDGAGHNPPPTDRPLPDVPPTSSTRCPANLLIPLPLSRYSRRPSVSAKVYCPDASGFALTQPANVRVVGVFGDGAGAWACCTKTTGAWRPAETNTAIKRLDIYILLVRSPRAGPRSRHPDCLANCPPPPSVQRPGEVGVFRDVAWASHKPSRSKCVLTVA